MLSAMETEKINETQDLSVMLSDAAWNSLLPFLKVFPNVYVGKPETCRRFLSVLVWITKQGATWRALPKAYGYWNTIYRRFGRWCDAGVFEKLHEHFHDAGEISALLVDSTIMRAHSSAAGAPKKNGGQESEALGRIHGGFTTKLNAAVSGTFLPLRFILTAGACHDGPLR
jgi:transposase